MAVFRRLLVFAGAALFAIGTIGGLLLSVYVGLFGFQDSLSAPYAVTSLILEAIAFVVLGAAAALTLVLRREVLVHGRPTVIPVRMNAGRHWIVW